jgi:hypothetical protein
VGITMIGRAVNKHYLLFTGAHRLVQLGATGMTVTGVVLAGGQGSRMGGADKGLQAFPRPADGAARGRAPGAAGR